MRARLGLGLARQPVQSGAGYLPETLAYAQAVIGAGGTFPDELYPIVDTAIKAFKDANLWDKFDNLHLAGYDIYSMLVNMKNPSNVATPINSPSYLSYNGIYGDGSTKYIDFNVKLTETTKFTGGKGTMAVKYCTSPGHALVYPIGVAEAIYSKVNLIFQASAITRSPLYSSTYTQPPNLTTGRTGLFMASIGADKINRLSVDGVQVASVDVKDYYSTANVYNANVYGLCANVGGTPAAFSPADGKICVFMFGGDMTSGILGTEEHALFHTITDAYDTAVGAL